ncbi:transposase [Spirosoma sp. BT702]|uniref:Transposase n=1 Tax=Spirosoma profusum TaxID=2771354 RepID=A0A927GAQ7_9BACT|nr:transposase [Spirosoma profusum]MBD2705444.1 transposase [Spirosoma profusum]
MSEAFASLATIVAKTPGLTKPRIQFLTHALHIFLSLKSRINFLMIARYSDTYTEQTARYHFEDYHDFTTMNATYLHQHGSGHYLLAFDASYLPKSGTKTPGLGKYWSGCAGRALLGLELGLLSAIDVDYHTAFHLDAALTPGPAERAGKDISLIDHYAQVVLWSAPKLLNLSSYLAVDAYFAKKNFIDRIQAGSALEIISLLRQDANLRYLYSGPRRTGKGAPKQYDGKIDLKNPDLNRFELVSESATERVYTALVNCVFLKRTIRLAYVQQVGINGSVQSYRAYFSTALKLAGLDLVRYYRLRYQQEFLIRDAKQHTGLSHSQARSVNKLEFHTNLALSAINVAKVEGGLRANQAERKAFSMADVKTRYHNELLLNRFISSLPDSAKLTINQTQVSQFYSFGCIAA